MQKLDQLKKLGLFRACEVTELGYTNVDLSRLYAQGFLQKFDRGVYKHVSYTIDPNIIDFAVACTRFGESTVVGGLSALFYYNLIETVPSKVWLLVPSPKKTVNLNYQFMRTLTPLTVEVKQEKEFKIVTLERALVEGFYFSTKIGLDLCMKATGVAIKENLTNLSKIAKAAKGLNMNAVINKHWEALEGIQFSV